MLVSISPLMTCAGYLFWKNLWRLDQVYPPTQAYEPGVGRVPYTSPGGPSLLHPRRRNSFPFLLSVFLSLLPASLEDAPTGLLSPCLLNPLLEKQGSFLAQTCSCSGLSQVLGRHSCPKARVLWSWALPCPSPPSPTLSPGQTLPLSKRVTKTLIPLTNLYRGPPQA